MKNINVHIDYNEILKKFEDMPKEEMDFVYQTADYMYSQFDVPVTLKDHEEIKSNMLIAAMYIIGQEVGKQITEQTKE